jgi:hypothetical protein
MATPKKRKNAFGKIPPAKGHFKPAPTYVSA